MQHLGDRRSRVRFEVVGALPGSLEVVEPVRIVNISKLGMLVASPIAPAIATKWIVRLQLGGDEVSVDTRVRHLRPATREHGAQFLVGLEFLSSSPRLEQAIDQIAISGQST